MKSVAWHLEELHYQRNVLPAKAKGESPAKAAIPSPPPAKAKGAGTPAREAGESPALSAAPSPPSDPAPGHGPAPPFPKDGPPLLLLARKSAPPPKGKPPPVALQLASPSPKKAPPAAPKVSFGAVQFKINTPGTTPWVTPEDTPRGEEAGGAGESPEAAQVPSASSLEGAAQGAGESPGAAEVSGANSHEGAHKVSGAAPPDAGGAGESPEAGGAAEGAGAAAGAAEGAPQGGVPLARDFFGESPPASLAGAKSPSTSPVVSPSNSPMERPSSSDSVSGSSSIPRVQAPARPMGPDFLDPDSPDSCSIPRAAGPAGASRFGPWADQEDSPSGSTSDSSDSCSIPRAAGPAQAPRAEAPPAEAPPRPAPPQDAGESRAMLSPRPPAEPPSLEARAEAQARQARADGTAGTGESRARGRPKAKAKSRADYPINDRTGALPSPPEHWWAWHWDRDHNRVHSRGLRVGRPGGGANTTPGLHSRKNAARRERREAAQERAEAEDRADPQGAYDRMRSRAEKGLADHLLGAVRREHVERWLSDPRGAEAQAAVPTREDCQEVVREWAHEQVGDLMPNAQDKARRKEERRQQWVAAGCPEVWNSPEAQQRGGESPAHGGGESPAHGIWFTRAEEDASRADRRGSTPPPWQKPRVAEPLPPWRPGAGQASSSSSWQEGPWREEAPPRAQAVWREEAWQHSWEECKDGAARRRTWDWW